MLDLDHNYPRHIHHAVKLAVQQAEQSPMDKYRHGAVLGCNGKVLAVGHNTHHWHAEACVLDKIPTAWHDEDLWLVVVRINKRGDLRLSKPCGECVVQIERSPVVECYYSV